MVGGDTVVADRLDPARQAARAGATDADLARIWHDGLTGTNDTGVAEEAHPL